MNRFHISSVFFGRAVLIVLTWTAGPNWALADPIYIQRPARGLGGSASQHDPTGVLPFEKVTFDDFSLTRSAAIDRVEWFGSYDGPVHEPLDGWTIAFFSDQAGLPGRLLRSISSRGNPFEQFVESDASFTAFHYGTDLGIPFELSAHTKYWIAIELFVPFPPQWFWRDAVGGDNRSAQATVSESDRAIPISHDRAFALFTSTPPPATPEPSTVILLITGVAGLVRSRRRERHSTS